MSWLDQVATTPWFRWLAEGLAVGGVLTTLFKLLPPLAAGLSIIYYGILIVRALRNRREKDNDGR